MDDGETSEKLYAHYLARKVCEDVGVKVQLLVVEIWCGTKLGWRELMETNGAITYTSGPTTALHHARFHIYSSVDRS
jgi:hypothetical protein